MDKNFIDYDDTQTFWSDLDFERAVLGFISAAVELLGGEALVAQCRSLANHMGGEDPQAEDVIELLIKGRLPHDLSGIVATYAYARDAAEKARKAAARRRKAPAVVKMKAAAKPKAKIAARAAAQ